MLNVEAVWMFRSTAEERRESCEDPLGCNAFLVLINPVCSIFYARMN
jgi:hypothetical protein